MEAADSMMARANSGTDAIGAHVAEGHKPYLKFIWRDVIFQRFRRCPFGQSREAPSPASPALGSEQLDIARAAS